MKSSTDEGATQSQDADATWTGVPMSFPRIQGADCCGHIVRVGKDVDPSRIGERVINSNTLRFYVNYRPMESWVFGSECDGAFAQYMKAPSCKAHKVDCDWSDVELASISCSYSTAENLLHRAGVRPGEHVVITGIWGGRIRGSAAGEKARSLRNCSCRLGEGRCNATARRRPGGSPR